MALVVLLTTGGLTCDGDPDDDVVRGVGLHGAQVLAGVSLRHRADHQHPVVGPLSAPNTLISHIILLICKNQWLLSAIMKSYYINVMRVLTVLSTECLVSPLKVSSPTVSRSSRSSRGRDTDHDTTDF